MSCEEIRAALSMFDTCEETPDGARIATHCLYPSFESVRIYVAKTGDSFRVHDGGGAHDAAWLHGRDEGAISRALIKECSRFRLALSGETLVASGISREWLGSAILSVANASASAANTAVAKMIAAAEEMLVDRIQKALSDTFGVGGFKRSVEVKGKSGGARHFDFAVRGANDNDLLINGVSPHHSSISAKYVAFADAEGDQLHKFAVFDRRLETDDTALLQQVASIVPIGSLSRGAKRVLAHG